MLLYFTGFANCLGRLSAAKYTACRVCWPRSARRC